MDPTASLAADGRSLDRLRHDAAQDPAKAARAAASQFEALFMQSLLKGLRDTIPKSGLTGGSATDTYTSLLDQQLSQQLAGRPGGLGEVIARQLARHYGTPAGAGAQGGAGFPVGPRGAGGLPVTALAEPLARATATEAAMTGRGASGATATATAAAASGTGALVMPKRAGSTARTTATMPTTTAAAAAATTTTTTRPTTMAAGPATAASRSAHRPTGPNGSSRVPSPLPEVERAVDLVRANPAGASAGVRAAAAATLASGRAVDPAARRQKDFVDSMWPHAVAAQRRTGMAPHLVIGQAALESGWGNHQIRHADGSPSHNLFGIKAGRGWTGRTVETMTTEFIDGRPVRLRQRFRAYDSYADAFADWSRLMTKSPRYEGIRTVGHDPGGYARRMQAAGYATDPAYADKLEKTIRRTLALRQPVI